MKTPTVHYEYNTIVCCTHPCDRCAAFFYVGDFFMYFVMSNTSLVGRFYAVEVLCKYL